MLLHAVRQISSEFAVAHFGRDCDGDCHDIGGEHHDREDVEIPFRPDQEVRCYKNNFNRDYRTIPYLSHVILGAADRCVRQ
jgi:hypothetical protein